MYMNTLPTHIHSSIRSIGYSARAFLLLLFYSSSLFPEAGFKLNSWNTFDFHASLAI